MIADARTGSVAAGAVASCRRGGKVGKAYLDLRLAEGKRGDTLVLSTPLLIRAHALPKADAPGWQGPPVSDHGTASAAAAQDGPRPPIGERQQPLDDASAVGSKMEAVWRRHSSFKAWIVHTASDLAGG